MRKPTFRWLGAFGVIVAIAWSSAGWSEDAAVPADWTPKSFNFTYMGFTTKYSCDGLRDAVRTALLQLGARKDMNIVETGCVGLTSRPSPFPGVAVKMHVLVPADAAATKPNSPPPVSARWKPVNLNLNSSALSSQPGTCELVEQINQKIVPLFTTRNVDFKATCIPHQLDTSGPLLRAEVLAPSNQKTVASMLK